MPTRFGDRLSAGDESVLVDVQRRFCPALRRMLLRRYSGCLHVTDVDAILNWALFRLWINRKSFDARRGALQTWFWQIAVNGARNVIKRLGDARSVQLEYTDPSLLDARAIQAREAPMILEPKVASAELKAAVSAVGGLPDIQRRVILADAAAPGGVAPAATLASELGLTCTAVRVYRHRAMRRLRAQLRVAPAVVNAVNAKVISRANESGDRDL